MSSYYVIDSNDFRDFADLCFQSFGDRVKHWFTLNEPETHAGLGFDSSRSAPGRCSAWVDKACQAGDSATEPRNDSLFYSILNLFTIRKVDR